MVTLRIMIGSAFTALELTRETYGRRCHPPRRSGQNPHISTSVVREAALDDVNHGGELVKLVGRINASASVAGGGGREVTWMVADVNMAWAFPVAKKRSSASASPSAASALRRWRCP
ncbi:hypothetical protein DAI22_03g344800 [Oryza sativa Japonica Group]|uniref:Expressed protein n=1 Tax=Oryza sativa subsp. japonica TaxID=39947 RepID=Q10CL0_ORYSJ|nr:expressed protein [Oryza sativa Japonica Group]KAF2941412.1 hypothetical protein DAI22_03g344800 [Oryza sativa Japonica Group]